MWEIVPISKILIFLGGFLVISILVIIAIMLDLWDGVQTARKLQDRVHSHKLRVTIAKMSEYWRLLMIGFLLDCIGIVFSFYILPFVAAVFGVGLIIVEIKSMFEHAKRRKSHTTELPGILRAIVACANEKDAHELVEKINILFTERQPETSLNITNNDNT